MPSSTRVGAGLPGTKAKDAKEHSPISDERSLWPTGHAAPAPQPEVQRLDRLRFHPVVNHPERWWRVASCAASQAAVGPTGQRGDVSCVTALLRARFFRSRRSVESASAFVFSPFKKAASDFLSVPASERTSSVLVASARRLTCRADRPNRRPIRSVDSPRTRSARMCRLRRSRSIRWRRDASRFDTACWEIPTSRPISA